MKPKDDIPFLYLAVQHSLNHQREKKVFLHLPFDYRSGLYILNWYRVYTIYKIAFGISSIFTKLDPFI